MSLGDLVGPVLEALSYGAPAKPVKPRTRAIAAVVLVLIAVWIWKDGVPR